MRVRACARARKRHVFRVTLLHYDFLGSPVIHLDDVHALLRSSRALTINSVILLPDSHDVAICIPYSRGGRIVICQRHDEPETIPWSSVRIVADGTSRNMQRGFFDIRIVKERTVRGIRNLFRVTIDIGQIAESEGHIPNACDAIGDNDCGHLHAKGKGIVSDGSHGTRDGHRGQAKAVSECIAPNRCY